MTRLARIRLVADYLAATRNEIAVDEKFLRLAHVKPAEVGYIPRVPLWLNKGLKAPMLTRLVWRFTWVIWLAGGAFAYFALELIKLERLRKRIYQSGQDKATLTDGAVLGLSSRVCDVMNAARFPWLPKTWLTCPWVPLHNLPKDAVNLSLISLLTKSELREAFICSLRAAYVLAYKPTSARWALQGYTALRWFIVRNAVDKLTGVLVTTQHYDRWAVLVDRSTRAIRLKANSPRTFVMVQHGAMGGLGSVGDQEDYSDQPPTRITYVDELHTYNLNEEIIFRRDIFTKSRQKSALAVFYFSPTVDLTGELVNDQLQLLFVGHPLCEEFQSKVFQALKKVLDFEAFYKPHPKAPMSASMRDVGWTVIEDSLMFPRVNLLVSYPSTLVIEYEGVNVEAMVHPLDISPNDAIQFVQGTLEKIKLMRKLNPLETETNTSDQAQCVENTDANDNTQPER